MHLLDFALRSSGLHATFGNSEIVLDASLAFVAGALGGFGGGHSRRAGLSLGIAALACGLTMGGPLALANGGRPLQLFGALSLIYPLCGAVLGLSRSPRWGNVGGVTLPIACDLSA